MHKVTRRRFIKWLLGGAAAVGASALGGAGYVTRIEPYRPTLERVDVTLSGLPASLAGFTILQISDLHRGTEMAQEDISRAVRLALQQEADLVVLTGDYVSRPGGVSQFGDYALSCAEALSPLCSLGDVLACLGNHDHWTDADAVSGALGGVGIAVLRNEAREAADGLWVAAVDDVWEQQADLEQALEEAPAGAAVVLLAHEPDYADEAAADGRVSLQLSGHSHGGQVRLPFIGAPVTPYLARKYQAGLYQVGAMWLYVNRGVGLIAPAVRFNCRPEVTLLTLRRTNRDPQEAA